MIGTIGSIVTKVVDTVSGPLHTWGTKTVVRKAVVSKKAKKAKCCSKKCRRC